MSRCLIAAAIFTVAIGSTCAEDIPSPQQQLDSVLAQHAFFQSAPVPLVLEADFTGQGIVPVQGHVQLRWQSKDHWWSWIDFGPFQQIRVRNGEMEYTKRNTDFMPLQVEDLFRLIGMEAEPQRFTTGRVVAGSERGVSLICVEARSGRASRDSHKFCVDATSRDLVSNSWSESPTQPRMERFGEYAETDGMRYPRHLEMYLNSSKLLSVDVKLFRAMPFDTALLNPPANAISRRKCGDMSSPVPIKRKGVEVIPEPAMNLESLLAVTILADGSVGDVRVQLSGGSVLDNPAVAAIKKWKFKPAMCGGDPVVDDVDAQVDYQTFARRLRVRNRVPRGATSVTFR